MAEETKAATSSNPSTEPKEPINTGNSLDMSAGSEAKLTNEEPKINGNAEHTANEISDQADTAAAGSEDTEMKNMEAVPDTVASGSEQPAVPVTPTPVSAKKASNGSSKRKSSGVPEHKTKKLNKKRSKPAITHLDAQPGEYYLARMKGHPPWPSVICDEEMLPQSLIDTRPVTTKLPDGTFKKPEYAEGGKRAHERTFPIMFLQTNEFAWMPNTDLTSLDPTTCAGVDPKGKSKVLVAAYEKASENQSLDHFKKVLQDHQEALQADAEAQAEREAKKASKAKRKSVDASALTEDADEMEVDEAPEAAKPKSKKRKKEAADGDDGEEKPAKTPKTSTKLKLSTPKTPATEPTKKKAPAKPKASTGKKAAAKVTSDEDAVDTPKAEEKPLTAEEKKEKKEKMVLYYRHKLQRTFLSRDTMPKEEEMKPMSDFLKELENYPDLEGSIIRTTKIHKVLKAMLKLPSIPLDEQFTFKQRAHKLLDKWNDILINEPNPPVGDKNEESKPEASTATTNGESKDVEKQAKISEAGKAAEAAAPEEENKQEIESKIGTTTEGEKDAEKVVEGANSGAPVEVHQPSAVEAAKEPTA